MHELSKPPPLPLPPSGHCAPQYKTAINVLLKILGWIFGILMAFVALAMAHTSLPAAVLFACAAALLLPPIRKFVYAKTRIKIPVIARLVAIAFLFWAGIAAIKKEEEAKAARLDRVKSEKMAFEAKELERRRSDEYWNNRKQILSPIRGAIEKQEWETAATLAKDYLSAGDKELEGIYAMAAKELEKIKSAEDAKEAAKKAITDAKAAREKEIQSQFSVWDGSHRELERYIKKNMNDPKSYEHVQTKWYDRGDTILVVTTYRGKNAFGAVVMNTTTATADLSGSIIEVSR